MKRQTGIVGIASTIVMSWAGVNAQSCPTPPTVVANIVQNDIHVDDTAPFGLSNGPHFYYHASALRVASENMDGDGTKDIIVGGNSGPAVAVRWFASGGDMERALRPGVPSAE